MGYELFVSHSAFQTSWNDVFKTKSVKEICAKSY